MVVKEGKLTKEEKIIKDKTTEINKKLMGIQAIISAIRSKINKGEEITEDWIKEGKRDAKAILTLTQSEINEFKEELEKGVKVNEKYFEGTEGLIKQIKDKINDISTTNLYLDVNREMLENELDTLNKNIIILKKWIMSNKGNIIR